MRTTPERSRLRLETVSRGIPLVGALAATILVGGCGEGASFKGGEPTEVIAKRAPGSTHGEVDATSFARGSSDQDAAGADGSGSERPESATPLDSKGKGNAKGGGSEDGAKTAVTDPEGPASSENVSATARVLGQPAKPALVAVSPSLQSCFSTALGKEFTPAEGQKVESYTVSVGNRNGTALFSDGAGTPGRLVLLRIDAKNVNSSSFSLDDPKASYCVEMTVKNMNNFKMRMHCGARVAVRADAKNANGATLQRVKCDS